MSTSKRKNPQTHRATRDAGTSGAFQPRSRRDMLVSAARERGRKAAGIPLIAELTAPPNSEALMRACDATTALARRCLEHLNQTPETVDREVVELVEKCAISCHETHDYLNGSSIHCAAAVEACLQTCRECVEDLGAHPDEHVQSLVAGCHRCLAFSRDPEN